ncbi:hypothetical protein NP493_1500g00045 [Ridgeia piscesae]|uniref:NACHT domain-containing protein n=1 Tax=Ridgeia piscesae TaxID=27915 RepID=A0AAD9NC83_RIDPI|nr:hypothetical protein NP493_1500g00045 [Ridgeia piscesae]
MENVPASEKPDQFITSTVRQGNTGQFDGDALYYCLLDSGTDLLEPETRTNVEKLRAQSKALDDATSTNLPDEDFRTRLQVIQDVYRTLKWDQSQLRVVTKGRLSPEDCERLKEEKFEKIVREKVKKALREMYRGLRIPVQQSVGEDTCHDATFEDMFVDLRLDRFGTTALPETLDYRDVEKLQELMQSSERILLSQLFDMLHDKDVPRTVLILGRPGVGKTTVIKQMGRLWAEGKLWKDTVEYLFVVTLRHYQQDRELTLADLLLDGLGLTESERNVAMELFRKQRSKLTFWSQKVGTNSLTRIPESVNGMITRSLD